MIKKGVCLLVLLMLSGMSYALPIFPGAVGFGTDTRGAYGADEPPVICVVDTLGSSHPGTSNFELPDETRESVSVKVGSLRECIGYTPRPAVTGNTRGKVIVFEVAGYIEFKGAIYLSTNFTTIAGQTAPPPGITMKGTTLRVMADDVVIQHIRARVGDDTDGRVPPYSRDAINAYGKNVVIDHCSMSWALDENTAPTGTDMTMSNCIVSEGLERSINTDAYHTSKGVIASGGDHVSLLNNLIAHHTHRSPYFQHGKYYVGNNLVYNPGDFSGQIQRNYITVDGQVFYPSIHTSFVGNVVKAGRDSGWTAARRVLSFKNWMPDGSEFYLQDNIVINSSGIFTHDGPDDWSLIRIWGSEPNDIEGLFKVHSSPLWPQRFINISSDEVEEHVLSNAGAWPVYRYHATYADVVDKGVIDDVKQGTGRMVNCVGPGDLYYPTGTAEGGSSNTLILDDDATSYEAPNDDTKLVGKKVIITSGRGADGQKRDITSYSGSTKTLTVSPSFSASPDTSSNYAIVTECSINAGGWPYIAPRTHTLDVPSSPHTSNGDYTNLEYWLHELACVAEGRVCDYGEEVVCSGNPVTEDCLCGGNQCSSGNYCCAGTCQSSDCVVDSDFSVFRATGSVTIDGDCSEYSRSDELVHSWSDNSAVTYMLWDEEALYMCASVDDTQVNALEDVDDRNIHSDDGFFPYLDYDNDKNPSIDGSIYKFDVNALGTILDIRFGDGRNRYTWNSDFESNVTIDGTINDNDYQDSKVTYEIKIHWSDFELPAPSAGKSIGFDLLLTDMDDDGSEYTMHFDESLSNPINPSYWGTIMLSSLDGYHRADTSKDLKIEMSELIDWLERWKSAEDIGVSDVMEVIGLWLQDK